MKKTLTKFCSFMFVCLCSLVFFMPINKTYGLQPYSLDEIESHYLISNTTDGSNIYLSNVGAGITSGYGKFVLGAKDVELTTNANHGFRLMGWNITYLDQDNRTLFIDNSNLTDNAKSVEIATGVNAVLTFTDKNNDGNFDAGSFRISTVFENLNVDPVFDFIYYNVDATEIEDLGALNNHNALELNNEETLFFAGVVEKGQETQYKNAYIKRGSTIYYYADLYSSIIEDERLYYTYHKMARVGEDLEIVNYNLGAFRYADIVDMQIDVATNDDVYNSVNIDLAGVDIVANETINLNKGLGYTFTQDDLLRTNQISIQFEISDADSYVNQLKLNYHNLYIANVVTKIDDVAVTDNLRKDILSVMNFLNEYSKISDGIYFVKDVNNNSNNAFRVSTAPTIVKVIDGVSYVYYNFDLLDGSSDQQKNYYEINSNFDVTINFASVLYNVDFRFVLLNDGALTLLDGYNVEKSLTLKRGETFTQTKTEFSDNLGFKFYGFTLDRDKIVENTSIELTIDNTKPENVTVLMLFNFVDYSIKFTNHDQITLNDGTNSIFAIESLTLNRARSSVSSTSTIANEILRENSVVDFDLTFNIFDLLELNLNLNEGFNLIKIALAEKGESLGVNNVSFTISQTLINQYAKDNVLTFYVYEDFDRYTINYYIDPTQETNLNTNVIMADIDVDMADAVKEYAVVERLSEGENQRITITISNLKLYDVVNLKATGKSNELDGKSYDYIFVRFTENDKTSLTNYTKENQTYIYSETISSDRNIKVVFSMPSSKLIVSINSQMDDAFDLQALSVYQNGREINQNLDNSYSVETGEITVVLNPNGEQLQDLFAFGYEYVGYSYHAEGLSDITGGADLSISINVIGTSIQYLTLNFEYVEYRLKVQQINSTENEKFVDFDGFDYMLLSLDNLNLRFEMPEGYYVSNAFFMKNGQNEYESLAQDNDYSRQRFRHLFTEQEFKEIATAYSEKIVSGDESYNQIVLRVVYQIHTYKVRVEFELSNAKNNYYDSLVKFPSLNLVYVYDGVDSVAEQELLASNVVEFKRIPYGSNITLSLSNGLPAGFSATIGWADNNGNALGNSNTLNVRGVTNNYNYKFILDYMSYSINLVYNSHQGNPQSYVNDAQANRVSAFDKLTIYTNAVKTNGFKFTNLSYYAPEYSAYTYDESSWNELYSSLFVFEYNEYLLNVSDVFDSAKAYYTMKKVLQNYSESTIFNVENFNANNFVIENNQITFNLEYDYIQIKIANTSAGYNNTEANLKNGDLNIAPEDYASFVVSKIDTEDAVTVITGDETVDFRDRISILISLNSVDIEEDLGYVIYNLSDGLYLHMVTLLGEQQVAVEQSKGRYILTFSISDLIEKVPDDETINITYYFNMINKAVTLTTNIPNAEFYKDSSGRVNFYINYDELETGFGAQTGDSAGESELSRSFQFLGKIRYTYSFDPLLDQYFVISQIKAYKADGEEIDSSEFSRYGIYAAYTDGENAKIKHLEIRFVDNITVKLQVVPIIRFNGATVDNNGNYVFTRNFACDSTGAGLSQSLRLGNSETDAIQTSQFILNCLRNGTEYNVYYINKSGLRDTPINVGVYELIMNFNTEGEYAWMSSIELSYKIYLIINQRNISLNYDIARTFDKVYDGKSTFNADSLRQYIVLTDGSGLNIRYANQRDFVLQNQIVATITYTNRNTEVETNRANEDVFYNLSLVGFKLADTTFNNNFNLTTTDYVIRNVVKINRKPIDLTGIVVNDKVFDGTDTVTLGTGTDIQLSGIIAGDDVRVITENIKLNFEDTSVGVDKKINVNSADALIGDDASNYVITAYSTKATIYPYSISVDVEGFGTITIYNNRGLTDPTKANLIPIKGKLGVEMIIEETPQYVSVYHLISNLLPRGRVYAFGFNIYFEENGVKTNLSKDLTLSLPRIDKLTSVGFLTGDQVGELNYQAGDGSIVVELSQFEADVNMIILTKQRTLFKLWQIILIVISVLLLIIIIIIIFLTIRKKKQVRYSVNDKI